MSTLEIFALYQNIIISYDMICIYIDIGVHTFSSVCSYYLCVNTLLFDPNLVAWLRVDVVVQEGTFFEGETIRSFHLV